MPRRPRSVDSNGCQRRCRCHCNGLERDRALVRDVDERKREREGTSYTIATHRVEGY